jgi:hypothetical protein
MNISFKLLFFVKSLTFFSIIGAAMSDEPVLVIGTKPLPPEAIATTLDVMASDSTLGEATSRLMKFGEITVGFVNIVRVSQQPESNADQYDRYLVTQPFTIHPPLDDARYEKVVLQVHFSDPKVIAYDLEPKRIVKEQKKNVKFELTPEFKFRELFNAKLGSLSYGLEFQVLEPTIIAYGQGENKIYWEYRKGSDRDDGIAVGTTAAAISLRVPSGMQRVEGTISYGIDMQWKLLRGWRSLPGKTGEYSFTWELPSAK